MVGFEMTASSELLPGAAIDSAVRAASIADLTKFRHATKLITILLGGAAIALASAAGASFYPRDGGTDRSGLPPVRIVTGSAPMLAMEAALAPRPKAVAVARTPRPRPDEPATTGSIEVASDRLTAEARVDEPWGEANVRLIDRLSTVAAVIAKSSPECDRIAHSGLSGSHSAPPDRIVIVVQCGNGTRFLFTRADLEANAPTHAAADLGPAADLAAACEALSGLSFPFRVRCGPRGFGMLHP